MPLVNDTYLTLVPYVPGKPVLETERELGITGVVKLASNENPLGASPKAIAAMQAMLSGVHDYPDASAFYLKQALARRLDVTADMLIIGNGADDLIDAVARACLRPGENIVYADPSFISYKMRAHQAGAQIRSVPLENMRFDLSAMARAIDAGTKLIFIANPNNPTGTYVTASELETFLALVPRDVVVVLDEAYIEYTRAPDFPRSVDIARQRPRTLVLRTFSKAYGLAGVRIGYGVGDRELIGYLERGRQPFNSSSLAQVAAVAALEDTEHVERSASSNATEMDRLVVALGTMHSNGKLLTVYDSQANFLMIDVHNNGRIMFEALLRQGVIVRPLANYGLLTHLRITIGTPEQNDKLIAAMQVVLEA
ncbi:MAG: histidinol-phosphate transaminase [Clostridia bacterium]|nr:histidinol-phosphate transaminase [Deltaproteobacteria bacterium]